jgi:aspartate aminotransferase-like enzyme
MVAPAVTEAMTRPLIDHRGAAFAALLERVTAALRPVFNTRGEIVVLGSSGTGAMEAAVVNLFSPGERLLSCPVGTFGKRFAGIAQSYGCVVESLDTPAGARIDPQALRAKLEADGARTIAGVLLTHNETSTGVANDMAALAPVLRAHGALTLVDSVSGLGASEFLMDEWGYDVVATASQKAFAAPPGVAMIAVGERARKKMAARSLGRFYFDLQRAIEFSQLGQTPWTPPISILFALDAALARYHAEGMNAAFARHARLAAGVRAGLERLGFTIFSRPDSHSDTVVAAYPPDGVPPGPLLTRLRDEHGVVLSGGQAELAGKIVRFGTMGDVGKTDIQAAFDAIESTLGVLTGGVVESTA